MSFVDVIAGGGASELEANTFESVRTGTWFDAFRGARSHTGAEITVDAAMSLDTVIGCVRLLGETIGAFPLKTYAETGDVRQEARDHPTYELLHRRPNPELPPVTLWGLVATHLVTWGDSFIGKSFVGSRVARLWPIRPDRVTVTRKNGRKLYWIRDERGIEGKVPYTSAEIIHVQGFTLDGFRGVSPIGLAREAIGAGLAIDEYVNRFFRQSAIPPGVLETEQGLTDGAYRRLKRDWKRKYGGMRRAGEVAILEEGLKFKSVVMPWKDIEFVAQQELSAKKVSRIFRVPASLIDASTGDSLTYRTVEGDNLQFLTHTLRVWLKRIAQSLMLDEDLFPPREDLMCEHVVDDLLVLDALSKARVRQIEVANKPWKRPSEIRRQDNLEPDEELDELALAPPAPPAPPAEPAEREEVEALAERVDRLEARR